MEEKIKANAELVIAQMRPLSGIDFGYDPQSVAWLDGYIERQRVREDITPELVQGLVNVFGSYLGECIINRYGGYWENQDGQWRVSFDDYHGVYPFSKVRKQFENGAEDSIRSFFEAIGVIFVARTGAKEADKKPWWKFW